MSELKINIIPCLQERRQLALLSGRFGVELEQQGSNIGTIDTSPKTHPSIPDKNIAHMGKRKVPLQLGKNTSTIMNELWSRGKGKDNQEQLWLDKMFEETKFDGRPLSIPDFSSHGFISACKNLSCSEKWTMYMKFFLSTENNKTNFMLFTHHNRIRGLKSHNDEDALIPFKENAKCNAYANAFCLKITVKSLGQRWEISYKIISDGFPDQGQRYKYCPDINYPNDYVNDINTDQINKGLKDALNDKALKDALNDNEKRKIFNIYVIRHGNALHNKPVNAKGSLRLDSPLTAFGMWQAYLLGKEIVEDNKITLSNVVLCCSFLKRTWLTCLYCLSGILAQEDKSFPNHLSKFMTLLTRMAIYKFYRTKYSKVNLPNIYTSQHILNYRNFAPKLIENIKNEQEFAPQTQKMGIFKKLFSYPKEGGKRTRKKRKRKKTRKKVYVKRKRRKTRKK